MGRKTVPIPILIFIWLAIIGGLFLWWQGRKETKEAGAPEILKESGPAALTETAPLKEKDTSSDERSDERLDERIIADLNQVRTALEMYHSDYGHYPTWLTALSVYISFNTYNSFRDNYWLGSTFGSPSYCLWAKLEKGSYFIASPYGTKEISHKPTSLEECCELTKAQ